MGEQDQSMRKQAFEGKSPWNNNVDKDNVAKLKKIIQAISWPTRSKVGKKASEMAWLIAQHADHDVHFQKKCLRLMKFVSQKQPDEVEKSHIAYLEDRVRKNENKKQIYGTQFYKKQDGKLECFPIQDEDSLNEKRKKMNLGSFEKYKAKLLLSNKASKK